MRAKRNTNLKPTTNKPKEGEPTPGTCQPHHNFLARSRRLLGPTWRPSQGRAAPASPPHILARGTDGRKSGGRPPRPRALGWLGSPNLAGGAASRARISGLRAWLLWSRPASGSWHVRLVRPVEGTPEKLEGLQTRMGAASEPAVCASVVLQTDGGPAAARRQTWGERPEAAAADTGPHPITRHPDDAVNHS